MRVQRIPGLALGVRKDGKVVKTKGYGWSNIEHQVPVKAETVFQSGSVGKQFTAVAAMLLVEDGKLALDQPIRHYLTELPAAWDRITIRHLLTHTSGIGDSYSVIDLRKDYTEQQLVEAASSVPIEFDAGDRWSYSNTGYQLLGIIIGKASGKFYGGVLAERVFQPLQMKTAQVISESDIVPNRAAGYRLVGEELKNQEWVAPTINTCADGALYLSILDMLKWDAALNAQMILKPTSYEQLWRPILLNDGSTHPYGFGWYLRQVNGRREFCHGGAWQGFQTYYTRYVDDGLSIVVLTNLAGCDPDRIAKRVASLCLRDREPITIEE
jgi:CubicO group peptidase (beta-lactamase class C family)